MSAYTQLCMMHSLRTATWDKKRKDKEAKFLQEARGELDKCVRGHKRSTITFAIEQALVEARQLDLPFLPRARVDALEALKESRAERDVVRARLSAALQKLVVRVCGCERG